MGDADDSYDFSRLDAFVEKLREGNEVVMGNRFQGGIRPGAMPWKNRYIGNPVLSGIGKLFFRCPVGDFHCGLRGFSREAFQRMRLQTTGMEFASEMVIKATLLRMRIAEVPTTLDKDGRSRPPHLRPWRDGWRHLRFMLLYSPRWLFLYPGIALTLLGLTLGIALLRGPLTITRHVALDVNSLLIAFAAVVLGFQAVAFSICARSYAYHEGLLPPNPKLERAFQRFKPRDRPGRGRPGVPRRLRRHPLHRLGLVPPRLRRPGRPGDPAPGDPRRDRPVRGRADRAGQLPASFMELRRRRH